MFRIGHGYDVHRFTADRPLVIGGVRIPFHLGLLGHSDADVLLHAIADALLGSIAAGDIGAHFPDSDPAYKNADSRLLLRRCAELLRARGWEIVNVDSTVIAQKPKLAPFIPEMRRQIAEACSVPEEAVSVKATTEEWLGFTGAMEGVAAHAVAMVRKTENGGE